ncbi:hypothetical protein I553_6614 [Mycobacterium xenopi 4042]|uniref:Uncharacterized protein n=1 Tax=Mycobacterium xenopi 4042 TaxID=1299334 RepID=X8BFW8_MYCXE|nr:hypothetical protein I553_6614 [Mycobacterium xenopi 4042]
MEQSPYRGHTAGRDTGVQRRRRWRENRWWGAYQPQFTHHMFLPVAPEAAEDTPAPEEAAVLVGVVEPEAPAPDPAPTDAIGSELPVPEPDPVPASDEAVNS